MNIGTSYQNYLYSVIS